jgi:hypothetical protein
MPKLLKALMEQPRSARELIEVTGLGHDGVHLFCESMHKEGLAHIVWWDYHDSQYAAVYAFGPGEDTTERWNQTEQELFRIFGQDFLSRTSDELSKTLNLHAATAKRSLNVLTQKGYLIKNPANLSWRRNPNMAFPDRRRAAADKGQRPPATKRPPQQSWYSPIL